MIISSIVGAPQAFTAKSIPSRPPGEEIKGGRFLARRPLASSRRRGSRSSRCPGGKVPWGFLALGALLRSRSGHRGGGRGHYCMLFARCWECLGLSCLPMQESGWDSCMARTSIRIEYPVGSLLGSDRGAPKAPPRRSAKAPWA